jgi:hypothetical protein
MDESLRQRRVQRVHLAQPLVGRLGAAQVLLVDVSICGARVEHHVPLTAGTGVRFVFTWEGEELILGCRVVRSRIERFSVGSDGLTVYHSGLEFTDVPERSRGLLKTMISRFVARSLEEQKLNARGAMPPELDRMPIFRYGGQLTANQADVAQAVGGSILPTARLARENGFVSFTLHNREWRVKRTQQPHQPSEGFTISASEDRDQAELLCQAYVQADAEGRKLIRLMAELSIRDGVGVMGGDSHS